MRLLKLAVALLEAYMRFNAKVLTLLTVPTESPFYFLCVRKCTQRS